MDILDGLRLFGGLALFLYGMNEMGKALEKLAGSKLKTFLENITSNTFKGFLLGLGITAIIQSSSATTVMVVGFVNSGLMTLRQATGVIFGANLGTSVTSWILSLSGIKGDSFWVQIFKPESFTPVLAFIGVILLLFQKNEKRKDIGSILLGFAVLMFGMEFMSGAVSGLKDVPEFKNALTMFNNPLLGVLVGTVFTAIIQSSSASVGVLQSLTETGSITYSVAIPVIMGQNIGTCVSALISSIGASKNARRAAFIHLLFNILGTLILLPAYYIFNGIFRFEFASDYANPLGIAIVHTVFKILALGILMPFSRYFEKVSCRIIRDSQNGEEVEILDERLISTPAVAIERCRTVAVTMAELSVDSLKEAMDNIFNYNEKSVSHIKEVEDEVDNYEDIIGTYLVKLSSHSMTEKDSVESSKLLHMIGDIERISDHSVNIIRSAEEINSKKLEFSDSAKKELSVMIGAINEILDISLIAFKNNDLKSAAKVEPLEQVIDSLRDKLKHRHIKRLQKQECTIELGFVLADILTNLERVSDHCSNIAGCLIEVEHESMDLHEYLRSLKAGDAKEFNDQYDYFKDKYISVISSH